MNGNDRKAVDCPGQRPGSRAKPSTRSSVKTPHGKDQKSATYQCRNCGKTFYIGSTALDDWGYTSHYGMRNGNIVALCSHKCLRAWEAPYLERIRAKMAREFALAALGTSTVELQRVRIRDRKGLPPQIQSMIEGQ